MEDDTGDGSMLCTDHPFKNNTPAGGICAFCLQEKLGKLVSSSFPIAVFPYSSSSSPSFRSDTTTTTTVISSSSSTRKAFRDISSNGIQEASFQRSRQDKDMMVVEENETASFDRKVSRFRFVGCGSRSFSGDFFERISTGFGDCTLRHVESQRKGKSKVSAMRGGNGGQDCMKERVRCGGLFSGFMITSSSSSSSS